MWNLAGIKNNAMAAARLDYMTSSDITLAQLSGRDGSTLVDFRPGSCKIHKALVEPLEQLMAVAADAGFELAVASGYRDFRRQCAIWNEKLSGGRAVLDRDGRALDIDTLDDWEKINAVLHWSALPGASRHHWGTDIDVYEKNAMPPGYRLQLTVDECQSLFSDFYRWLDAQLYSEQNFAFFRPYFPLAEGDNAAPQGVAMEPWHLSHGPTAWAYQQSQTYDAVKRIVSDSDILLRDLVLQNLEEIYYRYITVDARRYPRLSA